MIFCNIETNVSRAWISTENFKRGISSRNIIIITLICLNRTFGIFSSFVKVRKAGPGPKHRRTNSLSSETLHSSLRPWAEVCRKCSSFKSYSGEDFEILLRYETVHIFQIHYRQISPIHFWNAKQILLKNSPYIVFAAIAEWHLSLTFLVLLDLIRILSSRFTLGFIGFIGHIVTLNSWQDIWILS